MVGEPDSREATEPRSAASALSAACGVAATALAAAAMGPWALPAWPASSLAIGGLALSRRPGPALPRAVGAFFSLIALVASLAHIALLYTAGEILR